MRTGNPAGGAYLSDQIAPAHNLPLSDEDLRQMQESGGKPVPMVEHDGSTREEHIRVGQGHHTIGRSRDWSPAWRCDVDPEVGSPGLTVQDSLAAVHTGNWPPGRPHETGQIVGSGIIALAGRFDQSALGLNAFELLFVRSDLFWRQSINTLDLVCARNDLEESCLDLAAGAVTSSVTGLGSSRPKPTKNNPSSETLIDTELTLTRAPGSVRPCSRPPWISSPSRVSSRAGESVAKNINVKPSTE